MSLRTRMILFISLLLAGAVSFTTAILTAHSRGAMLEGQKEAGIILARVLARTAYIVEDFPAEMENAIADQMVIEATIASHFVAAAEAAGWTTEEINTHLQQIVASTTLSEFWITDEKGHAYLRNATDIDFTFEPDPKKNPQSAVFYQLIAGGKEVVVQPATRRDYDEKVFKYVGVGGVDQPRIVQVGYQAAVLEALRERVSLDRLSDELVQGGDIRAIRVVNAGIETRIFQAGEGVAQELTALDQSYLQQALQEGVGVAYLENDLLKVIEPVRGPSGQEAVSGAVMIYLPTSNLQRAVEGQVRYALLVSVGILLVGGIAALLISRLVTRPVRLLQKASVSVQQGRYQPNLLTEVLSRQDELGQLGLVFDGMAREVSARDRRLNLLKVIIPLGVSLSVEKDFNRLLETIVIEAQKITHADAGSLYLRTEADHLKFVILRNETLQLYSGGTTGKPPTLASIPLYKAGGQPNHHNLASYVALTGKRVNIKDAYETTEFDLSGTHAFDGGTGYHSQSFLTIPLLDTSDKVIGVLQLINAHDPESGKIVPFAEDEVVDSLGLITSAALSAYIREESLRQEINQLRIQIDHVKKDKQVEEITESDYFQQLQLKAKKMREKRDEKDQR